MSEHEQYAAVGQVVTEQKSAKVRLATLEAKARSYADSMIIVAQGISTVRMIYTPSSAVGFSGDPLDLALGKYPDRAEIRELLEELRSSRDRVEELAKSMRDMGL